MSSLLSFCLKATNLTFRGGFYKQIFGTAIGSPVSVVAANRVIEDVEQKALNLLSRKLPVWKRYIDDTLMIVQCDMLINHHSHLSSIEPSIIQFTMEVEENSLTLLGCHSYKR